VRPPLTDLTEAEIAELGALVAKLPATRIKLPGKAARRGGHKK
jgi:hypothetical protein